jgi:hypothetical protein
MEFAPSPGPVTDSRLEEAAASSLSLHAADTLERSSFQSQIVGAAAEVMAVKYSPAKRGGTCVFVQGGGHQPQPQLLGRLISRLQKPGQEIFELTFTSLLLPEGRGLPETRDTRVLHARLFVWSCEDQVVVSDIDGTLTKSDVMGHYHTTLDTNFGYTRK